MDFKTVSRLATLFSKLFAEDILKLLLIYEDISALYDPKDEGLKLAQKIRERKNAGATFTVTGSNDFISSMSILVGEGRQKRVRTISLTVTQGKFLYHLPFPTATFMSVKNILKKTGIDESHRAEVLDIIEVLKEYKVIEVG